MAVKNQDRPIVKCIKCGHTWRPYTSTPAQCPECHSKYWDRGESKISSIVDDDPITNKEYETIKKKIKLTRPDF